MVKIIAGLMGGSVAGGSSKLATVDQLRPLLVLLQKHAVTELDTARVYAGGKSEELLGATLPTISNNGAQPFVVQTKAPGFSSGTLTSARVQAACDASLQALSKPSIDLYYFHGPDRSTPLEESCRAIHELHQAGKITRFGVSNFSRAEVETAHAICTEHGWLPPTVYQGGYNPLGRTMETELLPTLRKLGMVFYAYSPLAGGFFSRSEEELRTPPKRGRMDEMKHFKSMYVSDLTLELRRTLEERCSEAGVTVKAATLRWIRHHSALGDEDGVILGASNYEQMEENLQACESGPLPQSVVDAFQNLWTKYREAGNSPPYCV